MKIGIISPSEIAFRRFLPALKKFGGFEYAGVAVPSSEDWDGKKSDDSDFINIHDSEYAKANNFKENYGGVIYESYTSLIDAPDIDALYIPLPPALHFKWAKRALEAGKHVFVEKPATCSLDDTNELIKIASKRNLALHENYMFIYHNQISEIDNIIESGELGKVRIFRISFGFPMRDANDFRYNKALGGGALFDAGGYTLKYARHLLGPTAKLVCAHLYDEIDKNIDIAGSATVVNAEGIVVQLAFGMDNDYRCKIDAWGSKASLTSDRVFTAPVDFTPKCVIKSNQEYSEIKLSADDAFLKSIETFYQCVNRRENRIKEYDVIRTQAEMVDMFLQEIER